MSLERYFLLTKNEVNSEWIMTTTKNLYILDSIYSEQVIYNKLCKTMIPGTFLLLITARVGNIIENSFGDIV